MKEKRNKDQSGSEYPYQNLSLEDLAGEEWKPIRDDFFEDYFLISNKGRVKKLSCGMVRQDAKGRIVYVGKKERIMKPHASKSYSFYAKQYVYQLSMHLQAEGRKMAIKVARMVFHTFVNPITDPKRSIIQYKDGDSLNLAVENLYLITKKEFTQKTRKLAVEVMRKEKWTPKQIKERGYIRERVVSQYAIDGKYMATYSCIQSASEITGVKASAIYQNIVNLWKSNGGFYWRAGRRKQRLDLEEISRLKKKHEDSNKQNRKVAKYDVQGNLCAVYHTIKDAAKENHIKPTTMMFYLEGRKAFYKGYIWKAADLFKEIPDRIDLDDIPLPRKKTEQKERDFSVYPVCKYPYQDMYPGDLKGEIWKGVVGFEKSYMVSNLGRVKRTCHYEHKDDKGIVLYQERILKQYHRKVGSEKQHVVLSFSLRTGFVQKVLSVPKAVYESFVNPLAGKAGFNIMHKDSDRYNNRVENLYARSAAQ